MTSTNPHPLRPPDPSICDHAGERGNYCTRCGIRLSVAVKGDMAATASSASFERSGSAARARRWWIAAAITLAAPGVGQFYNGQAGKGAVYYLLSTLPYLLLAFGITDSVSIAALLLIPLVRLVAVVDAVVVANRYRQRFTPKPYQRLIIYIFIFAGGTLIVRQTMVEAYFVTGRSMAPAIESGDHILIDKLRYRFITPQRGDVIMFAFDQDPNKMRVGRIIGLPGETLEIRRSRVFINGTELDDPWGTQSTAGGDNIPQDKFGPVLLPPEEYFVLGDNRHDSYDSRYLGFVERKLILGKIGTIYWSWSDEHEVRWNRIGVVVR